MDLLNNDAKAEEEGEEDKEDEGVEEEPEDVLFGVRDVEGELAVVGEMGGEVVRAGVGRMRVGVGEEVKGRIGVRVEAEIRDG